MSENYLESGLGNYKKNWRKCMGIEPILKLQEPCGTSVSADEFLDGECLGNYFAFLLSIL